MNILILGSGGREHALAWKIASSPECGRLFVAPGNPGTAEIAENLALSPMDFSAVANAVETHQINLVVVGPEDPLVAGIADYLRTANFTHHVAILGPDKLGAELEGSKAFAKAFMAEFGIPTARYAQFGADEFSDAVAFLNALEAPYVIKADGLAAGKGVRITSDIKEAEAEIRAILIDGKFGEEGRKLVLEEFLSGIELSVFVLTDGENYRILPEAKDYKRIGEGDTGLNTGGMGAVSPVPFADEEFMRKVDERIVQPSIRGISSRGMDYRGFLFIGLMNVNGDPFVIEYNVRMGDPETQVVMPRIQGDLLPALYAAANKDGVLPEVAQRPDHALAVISVSGGYPEAYEKGHEIQGLDGVTNCLLFHAGTRSTAEGAVVTEGGRVLAVVALDENLPEARSKAYRETAKISFEKQFYRRDIGVDIGG